MAEFIFYIIVNAASAIYLSWTFVCFFCPMFSIRWKTPGLKTKTFLFLVLVPFLTAFQMLRPDFMLNTENFMFQLAGFLICLILFDGELKKKVQFYLFYMVIEYTVELMAANIFVQLHNHFSDKAAYSIHQMQTAGTPWEFLCILLMNILFGVLFFRKSAQLMEKCFMHLHAGTTFQILLPLFAPAVVYGFFRIGGRNLPSPVFGAAYWIICAAAFCLFIRGIKEMRHWQMKCLHEESELQMLRKQLDVGDKMKAEYTSLRKWNHDVQNHLIALTYLMDMRRYPEALHYCSSFLSRIENATTSEKEEAYEA